MNEKYDADVENVYLSAINDRLTYESCLKRVKLLMLSRGALAIDGITETLRPLGDADAIARLRNSRQLRRAWGKIFDSLREPALEYFNSGTCGINSEQLKRINEEYGIKAEIQNHIDKAQECFDACDEKFNQALQETAEKNLMNELKDTPFKAIEYVYGKDISTVGANGLIELIKKAKGEIKSLNDAGVKSKYIDKEIKSLEGAIDKMVERLDSL